jgi:hypothetical protein
MPKYVLAVTLAGLLTARAPAADEPKPAAAPAVKVTAQKLAEDFSGNEAFADEQYRDKAVEVAGTVVRVFRSKLSSPRTGVEYIVELEREAAGGEAPLLFIFAGKGREQLLDLRPNDPVTIRGTCQGRLVWPRTPGLGGHDPAEIWFRDCQVVSAAAR